MKINTEAEVRAYKAFISAGMTPCGACGLIGNLEAESDGFYTNRLEYLCIKRLKEAGKIYTDESYVEAIDNGSISCEEFLHPLPGKQYGFGLAQWTTPARKSGLYTLAKQKGVSIADEEMQLEYLLHELEERFPSVLKVLKSAKTIKEASDIVLVKFECPADTSEHVKLSRAKRGQKFYDDYVRKEKVMTASEKRKTVVAKVKSREGKNQYTQGNKRDQVASGWSDCSSLQQWAYLQIGERIGSYTGAQIERGEWVTKGDAYPDENLLLPGDELFFAANYDNGRPYRVGHIEMYVGNGQLSGHGSGVGPTRKNMIAYCKQRNAAGKKYIGVKRYIKADGSVKNTVSTQSSVHAIVKSYQIWANATYEPLLRRYLGHLLETDGVFGKESKRVLILIWKYEMNKLKVGYTFDLANDNFGNQCRKYANHASVKFGTEGAFAYLLEAGLGAEGYYAGGLDGDSGILLCRAIQEFEKDKGLDVDSSDPKKCAAGPQVWNAVFN